MNMRITVLTSAAVAFLLAVTINSQAAPKIGVASAVKNDVQRVTGSGSQALAVGGEVFTNERIRTGDASTAQILFVDKTSLTVGARSELVLDRFVYDPSKGTGQVVMNAVNGAFRFITGSQSPSSYTMKTPVGTIGVRGTIYDAYAVNSANPAERKLIVILVQGSVDITLNGVKYTLSVPGTAFILSGDGKVQGPVTWDGSIINTGTQVNFPLYGWNFQGETLPNGLPDVNINSIDQLNAIIQGSIPAQTQIYCFSTCDGYRTNGNGLRPGN